VRDNLSLAAKLAGTPSGVPQDIIEEFDLSALLGQFPNTLSGGERQRVALARTLILSRPITLLDEPFSNIDVVLKRSLRRYIKIRLKDQKSTVVAVTHDQEDAIGTSDMVAMLAHGKLLQVGTPQTVYLKPSSVVVGAGFGDVGMVWFDSSDLGQHSKSISVGVRESDFETSCAESSALWRVAKVGQEYLGSRTRLFVRTQGGNTFSIVVPSEVSATFGDILWVRPREGCLNRYSSGLRIE
jgi:ABC-type sugar transport system ATPase subunit